MTWWCLPCRRSG